MNRAYKIAFDKLFHLEQLPFLSVDLEKTVGGNASCLAAITVSKLPLGTIGNINEIDNFFKSYSRKQFFVLSTYSTN